MCSLKNSTRQRLTDAALELFTSQGVTETTTRQIAELAEVNEVTLFRHFGSKHGLLLAVIEDSAMFTRLGESLVQQGNQTSSVHQTLKDYATACLQALERVPELVRSVVGESGQFPVENRQALGKGLTQANCYVAEYLETVIHQGHLHTHLPAEKLASLLNGMLLGYAVIEFTSEFHQLWEDRNDFLENLVELFLHGAVSQAEESALLEETTHELSTVASQPDHLDTAQTFPNLTKMTFEEEVSQQEVADLPAFLVHSILQRAKKLGLRDYALIYVLFGAGLTAKEIVILQRSHHLSDTQQHLLQVPSSSVRQVPVNQWISGRRYGSYTRNPLTKWLKNRKDNQAALFLNDVGEPISEAEIRVRWQAITEELSIPEFQRPFIEQAQQTWCVEMLVRGMTSENLSILTGLTLTQLQPYVRRAREKIAVEQAIRLDQKPNGNLISATGSL